MVKAALKEKVQRQTQSERSDAMRERLLRATLEVVAEDGWAQTSTQKICRRAGVSRGAQTHHFPNKASLLIAAVREMVAQYQMQMDAKIADRQSQDQTLEGLFQFLWDACFDGQLLDCWMEAMIAARTDEDFIEVVRETDKRAISSMRGFAGSVREAKNVRKHDIADIIEMTVYLLRGLVVQHGVHGDKAEMDRLFGIWKKLVMGQS